MQKQMVVQKKYKRPTVPFFPRVGGKSRLAAQIVKMIPKHETYVEPFAGAGAVFFKKDPAELEVLNDKDRIIYHLYKDMRTVGERVKAMDFRCSRSKFNIAKKGKATTPFKRLHQNLIVTKHSFGGHAQGFMGRNACAAGKGAGRNLKASAWRYKERLKHVVIRNQDWKKVAKKYDGPHTFFYFDPPYMTQKGTWGYAAMQPEPIAKFLKSLKGKWILSYENTPRMKKLFSGKKYTVKTVRLTYHLSGKPVRASEILVRNF